MADSKLKLSLVMDMVDRITAPIQKVTTATTKAGEKIKGTQDTLKRLGQQSSDIEHFKQLKAATSQTSQELAEAQAKAKTLAQQMKATSKPTRKMTADFNRANKAVGELKNQQQQETEQLQKMRGKLSQAGIATNKLSEATRRIKKETKSYNEQLKKEQDQLNKIAKQQERIGKIKERNSNLKSQAGTDALKVGAAVFGIKQLVDAQGEIGSAQGEIQSLGLNDAEVAAITSKAKEFSNLWAGTSQAEFIKASYDIKSGISSLSAEAVGEFTKIAAMTATATKSTVGEMTNLFATGYGIYNQQFQRFGAKTIEGWDKLSQAEKDAAFGTYFSDGIAASVQQFKTDGGQMQGAISKLGAAATSSNVPFAEQLSILGQLQATMSGSEAATKYKAFLNTAAVASEKLGMSFMDANDQLLSMPDILQELRNKYGDTLTDMDKMELKKAFGSDEAMALITQLYPEIDTLKGNIEGMNGSLLDGGKNVNKMASAIANGPAESMQLLSQRVGNMTAAIGTLFVPAMMFASDVIGTAAMGIASFTENFPVLSKVVAFVVVGLIALKTVLIATRLAQVLFSESLLFSQKALALFNLTQLKSNALLAVSKVRTLAAVAGMVALAGAQKALAAGSAIMTAAQWALNAGLWACPITWIVAGIMALVAAVVMIYKYWEPLTAFFGELWDGVVAYFSSGWDFIKAVFMWSPIGLVIQAWQPLMDFFSGLWDSIVGMFDGAMEWITALIINPIEVLKDTLGSAWDALFGGDGEEVTATVKRVTEDVPALSQPGISEQPGGDELLGGPDASAPVTVRPATQLQSTSYKFGDIIVQAAPGMDAQEVALAVSRQLREQQRQAERQGRTLALDT